MRHGFYLAVIQKEGSLHQLFTVTGGAGARNLYAFRQFLADLPECADRGLHRRAVVITIERVEKMSVFIDQCHLGSGRTGIDAQETPALVAIDLSCTYAVAVMTGSKLVVFLLVLKERLHTFHFKFHMDIAV